MSTIETVIVGAGPYGLSIAAHLKAAGKPFRIIGVPMESWKTNMPDGMFLKSEPCNSSLSDPEGRFTYQKFAEKRAMPYRAVGQPLPLAAFLEYAQWFQESAELDVVKLRLLKLTRKTGEFSLLLSDGSQWSARRVILATGHVPYRHMPSALSHITAPRALHTCDVNDPERFQGKRVVMVGGGQSSIETAALLAETGAEVRILVREKSAQFNDPPNLNSSTLDTMLHPRSGLSSGWKSVFYSESPLLFRRMPLTLRRRIVTRSFGPAGSWWLRARVESKISILTGHTIETAEESGERLRLSARGPMGPVEIEADHVIAGTGYIPHIDRLTYLSEPLRSAIKCENHLPALDNHYQSSVAGLHFVGATSMQNFGPVMRFIYGAKHPAAALARAL